MLRVGLTGGLGSGKSTVARMLARRGARVLSADELGRELMRPGTAVHAAIVRAFGPGVVLAGGELDRRELAQLAFGAGRIEELNAIVHPATIQRQQALAERIFREDPSAIVVVESALLFETQYGGAGGWRGRFDVVVLVTAPEPVKVARFIERSGNGDLQALDTEARRRLARMLPDEVKAPACDYVVRNEGSLEQLEEAAARLWAALVERGRTTEAIRQSG